MSCPVCGALQDPPPNDVSGVCDDCRGEGWDIVIIEGRQRLWNAHDQPEDEEGYGFGV